MTQLNDALADIPLVMRERLFESHIKKFGADNHQKIDFGYKYDFKVNKFPHALYYCAEKPKTKTFEAFISEPSNLSKKTLSMFSRRPDVNDGGIKPFGASGLGWTPPPEPKINLNGSNKKKTKKKKKVASK